jgi:hypothetical protein
VLLQLVVLTRELDAGEHLARYGEPTLEVQAVAGKDRSRDIVEHHRQVVQV